MKTLTICQPYPTLICLPPTDERWKPVENRRWPTSHRGPLAIHAGVSRKMLDEDDNEDGSLTGFDSEYGLRIADMVFGAIVATCNLVDCFRVLDRPIQASGPAGDPWTRQTCVPPEIQRKYPYLTHNQHVEGPFCFVLEGVVVLSKPIRYRGQLGLFEVPSHVFEGQEVTYQ